MSWMSSFFGALMATSTVENLFNIDGGSFTLDTALDSGTKVIDHSLGSTPDLVVVFSPANANISTTGVLAWALKIAGVSGNNYVRTGGNVNPRSRTGAVGVTAWSSTTFTITADGSGSIPLKIPANATYYWIAIKVL